MTEPTIDDMLDDPNVTAVARVLGSFRSYTWERLAKAAIETLTGLGWVGPEEVGGLRELLKVAEFDRDLARHWDKRATRELLDLKAEVLALVEHLGPEISKCSQGFKRWDEVSATLAHLRGTLAREGGVEAPSVNANGLATPERQDGSGEAPRALRAAPCGKPGCTVERKAADVIRHTKACSDAQTVAQFIASHADELAELADDETTTTPGTHGIQVGGDWAERAGERQ